jgi:glutamate-5-semialdehyde dehydrogenase
MVNLVEMGQRAKVAARQLAQTPTAQKNATLHAIADALEAHREAILSANRTDLDAGRANGMTDALLDRLDLQKRLDGVIRDARSVANLPDPVGEVFDSATLDNGLRVSKRRTPLGVLGVIYEARPNVTVDVATLSLKTGNAVILRGGKETIHSNRALIAAIREALASCGLPADAVQFIDSPDRQYVMDMLKLHQYIDMIIPRGGNGLHTFCRENSTIPVITGGIGICHLYVDTTVDMEAALAIIHNAKTQRPSVCNALDTVLVNAEVADAFLPRLVEHLGASGVSFRAEPRALAALDGEGNGSVKKAGPEDFDTEWLSLVLGLKVVDTLDEAIDHIREHSTAHSDGILSQTPEHIERFLNEVDSAAVYANASTRFTDGSALGLGAEIAISTQKMHARGPMGLVELTTYKWVIIGNGHVRP